MNTYRVLRKTNAYTLFKIILCASFALVLIMTGRDAGAEDPVLKALIDEAIANNPEIASLRRMVKAEQAMAGTEGYLDDPYFRIELMDIPKDNPLDLTPGNAMLTRYTIGQMFPFPGKLPLKKEAAAKQAQMAGAELAFKTLEVQGMVKETYLEYAFNRESRRITDEIRETNSYMARIAEVRYASGIATQQDLIKAQLESAMLSNEAIELDAEKEALAARLKTLLNRTHDSALPEPAGLPRQRVSFDLSGIIPEATENNPLVKKTMLAVESGDLNQRLAEKNYYPDFMLSASPVQRDGGFETFDVMFQINIPIWQGKLQGISDGAYEARLAAEAELANQKNLISLEAVLSAINAQKADRMRILFETSLVPQSEMGLESALKSYQSGKIDFLTLLDAQRQVKRTKIEHLRTILEYGKAIASIEKILGRDL